MWDFETRRCQFCSASSSEAELNVILCRRSKTNEQACLLSSQSVIVTVVNIRSSFLLSSISRNQKLILDPSQKFASLSNSPMISNHNPMNAYPQLPHLVFRLDSLESISRHLARYYSLRCHLRGVEAPEENANRSIPYNRITVGQCDNATP